MNYTLIGYQRSGTTWLCQHFRIYYGKEKWLDEYFSREKNFNNKISFLENERKNNNEYFVKWIVHQVQECQDWWNEFYKDFEKIKLLNKNVWRIFLSESYLRFNNYESDPNLWRHKDYYIKPFSVDRNWIKQFAKQYSDYIMFSNYNTLFDIDKITDEYVMDYLGNIEYKYKKQFKHDYEGKLNQDVELTKEILKNELKQYNITLLNNGRIT